MKEFKIVFAVIHYYNNGEAFEDYREYEDTSLFSSFECASSFFWDKVTSDYEGLYVLVEWELDTQKKKELERSANIPCTSVYDREFLNDYPEDYLEDYPEDYTDASTNDYMAAEMESLQDEIIAENEWLTHKGENYEVLHAIEEDLIEDELTECEAAFKSIGFDV